ncbi:innexin inx2 [Trichonephila inaurata madagascariensis]|uniref:Innexin n=1 Tax=Trichonephila inaurata madagascariensis TaxID=2747483 RepID=A0A8X6Y7U1_9ARAC|nr:innexin inx2 [Trichonephila inaurata madagascariensis]
MITLFSSLKGLLKPRAVCIDGFVFRLHSRWTVLILLCCSILLTCRQHFGEPINCLQRDVSRIKVLENFCWIHATFILPHAWNSTVGVQVPHPGIDRHIPGQNKVYHGYYQWVALVLVLQAIFFYLPRYIWKTWEKGVIKSLALNLHDPLLPGAESSKSCKLLVHSLHIHWGHFESYFKKYIFCELLSLINVLGQMWLLDTFLGGVFTNFGIKVVQWSEWDQEYRSDPLVKAFPRMTKCQFFDFGSSGDIQRVDALCLLPLNILNEKIFVFLWFWMVLLCCLTSIILFCRLLLIAIPYVRCFALVMKAPQVSKGALFKLIEPGRVSDWFVLYLLSKNIDPRHFKTVIGKLAVAMDQNGYVPRPSTSKDNTTYV